MRDVAVAATEASNGTEHPIANGPVGSDALLHVRESGESIDTTAGALATETLSLSFRIICDKSDDIFLEQFDKHARICEGRFGKEFLCMRDEKKGFDTVRKYNCSKCG